MTEHENHKYYMCIWKVSVMLHRYHSKCQIHKNEIKQNYVYLYCYSIGHVMNLSHNQASNFMHQIYPHMHSPHKLMVICHDPKYCPMIYKMWVWGGRGYEYDIEVSRWIVNICMMVPYMVGVADPTLLLHIHVKGWSSHMCQVYSYSF